MKDKKIWIGFLLSFGTISIILVAGYLAEALGCTWGGGVLTCDHASLRPLANFLANLGFMLSIVGAVPVFIGLAMMIIGFFTRKK